MYDDQSTFVSINVDFLDGEITLNRTVARVGTFNTDNATQEAIDLLREMAIEAEGKIKARAKKMNEVKIPPLQDAEPLSSERGWAPGYRDEDLHRHPDNWNHFQKSWYELTPEQRRFWKLNSRRSNYLCPECARSSLAVSGHIEHRSDCTHRRVDVVELFNLYPAPR